MHCLLVEHGKRCHTCAKGGKPRFEPLGPCPLRRGNRHAGSSPVGGDPDADATPAALARARAVASDRVSIKEEPIAVKRELIPGGGGGEAEAEDSCLGDGGGGGGEAAL